MANMLSRVNPVLVTIKCTRTISTSVTLHSEYRKGYQKQTDEILKRGSKRKPWDKRFPVNIEDVRPSRVRAGGSKEMAKLLPETLVAPSGIVDKQTQKFIPVPEMVPEFVVPDLTDFQLKPYVTYTAKEITQNELTPKDIFNSVYAANVEDAVKSGKIKVQNGQVHVDDGRVLDLETGQRIT